MMMEEFVDRTHFPVTYSEYKEIEAAYLACDEDKDVFCKKWLKSNAPAKINQKRVETLIRMDAERMNMQATIGTLHHRVCELENMLQAYSDFGSTTPT